MNQNKQNPKRHINPDHLALVLIGILAGVFLLTILLAVIIPKQTTPSQLTKVEQAEQSSSKENQGGKAASYTADTETAVSPDASAEPGEDAAVETQKKDDKDTNQSVDTDNEESDQETDSVDTSSMESLGSYDVNVNDHLSADVSITQGDLVVTATDAAGNVTTVLNEKGPYQNSSFTCSLPSGQYQVNIYGNASGWKFSFTAQ